MMEFLKGKKTYILSAIGSLVAFAYFMGWIDYQIAEMLLAALGFGAFATLKAGDSRIEKTIEKL